MPNYVTNTLVVRGPKAAVRSFYDMNRAEGDDATRVLTFERAVPFPKEWSNHQKYGAVGFCEKDTWYDWCPEHWGTKWDAINPTVVIEDECLTYLFKTAWAPPVPWLVKAFQQVSTRGYTAATQLGGFLRLTYMPRVELELCYENEDPGQDAGTICMAIKWPEQPPDENNEVACKARLDQEMTRKRPRE